jgi:hypothetical protein
VKPEFADNFELRMADALNGHLDWLEATYKEPVEMSIATGYFNAEGFAILADRMERLRGVRLLLGAEPLPPPRGLGDAPETQQARSLKRTWFPRVSKRTPMV